MQVNNLNLSPEEASAISEVSFYLLKNSATKKIYDLFGKLEVEMKSNIEISCPDVKNLNRSTGKIFRGENYRQLPYIVLDYPRLFSNNSVFAFRTMFWWGHEFSFTLHLQGEAFDLFRSKVLENFHTLYQKDIFYCVNQTPWQYNFDTENYLPIDECKARREEIQSKPFIKLSRKLPVKAYKDVYEYGKETFKIFMGLMK